MKKVTSPLDEHAWSRLYEAGDRGQNKYETSGSEDERDSECLAALVREFMEEDDGIVEGAADAIREGEEATSDADLSDGEMIEALEELSRPVDDWDDRMRTTILRVVLASMEVAKGSRWEVRRSVTTHLREAGFDAGICETKWETSNGVTLGSYEYIDVVNGMNDRWRYIVDVDFASEFEIARPTMKYSTLLAAMPRVLVCRPDSLRRVIRVAAEAARRSMKAQGLHLPPWRKNRHMQAKWFGPYQRTTTPVDSSPAYRASTRRSVLGFDVGKCRPKPAFKSAFSARRIAQI